MFKKIKENKNYQLIHDWLENPRYRALVKLLLWGIFFLFVFGALNTSSNSNPPSNLPPSTVEIPLSQMDNYEYQITIENDQIRGTRVGEKEVYIENGQKYQIENETIYKMTENGKISMHPANLKFDIRKLRPEKLEELKKLGQVEYTTEYKDQTKKTSYTIKTEKFSTWYNGSTTSSNDSINMTIYEKKNKPEKIELDLTNYKNRTYSIIIHYDKIGEIKKIEE